MSRPHTDWTASTLLAMALLTMGAAATSALGQSPAAEVQPGQAHAPALPNTSGGEVLDRAVAVVNGDLVLESDVDEEQRFSALQPLSEPAPDFTRARAVERLINRDLILQQIKIQPQAPVTDKELDDQLMQLRRELPACKVQHCETDAEWAQFVGEHGFTVDQVRTRWKQRMQVLRYIEQRFRNGVRISPEEIQDYYSKTLLPLYAKQGVKAPKLDTISDRVQEVLLQQQVSSLLSDWLKSLRAQGTVRILGADEAAGQ